MLLKRLQFASTRRHLTQGSPINEKHSSLPGGSGYEMRGALVPLEGRINVRLRGVSGLDQ